MIPDTEWHRRWQEGNIGWQKDQPNEHLIQHLLGQKLHKFDFEGTENRRKEEEKITDKRDLTKFRRHSYKRIIDPEEGEYTTVNV